MRGRRRLCSFLRHVHEHLGAHGAGRGTLRAERAVGTGQILGRGAVGNGLECPVRDRVEIGVGELFGDALSRLAADLVVAVEDLGHLLTGDGLGGLERAVLIAVDDLVRTGPQNGVGIPAAVRAVGELFADLALDLGGARHAVQDRHKHPARQRAVRVERGLVQTLHIILLGDIVDSLNSPVAVDNVGVRSGNDADAALRRSIGSGDGAAQIILDVVDEDLVVQHDGILQQLVVGEHIDAVAGILEHIVVGRDRVCSLRINIDILAVLQDLDVLDAVSAVNGDEHGLVVTLGRRLDRGVDGVLQAGNLQEAAHFTNGVLPVGVGGHGVAGRPFERVDDFLTGRLDDAERVAVRMDLDDLAVGDVAGRDVGTDAAAVDERDVSAGNGTVGVGTEVAEVGLTVADGAGAVGTLRGQVHGALCNDGVDQRFVLFLNGLDECVGSVVLDRVVSDQLRGELAVRDGQLADVDELRARGGQGDLLAVLVLDHLHLNGGVGMAVEHDVDAGGVGDQIGRTPRLGGFVDTQMRNGDDIGRTVLLGSVNGFLHLVVKVSAVIALREGIDEFAVGVLEVGRGRLGKRFGRVDADESDLRVAVGLDLIRLVAGQPLAVLGRIGQVAAKILILGLVDELLELRQGVVKFVVAEGSKIIADFIHNIDQIDRGYQNIDKRLNGIGARITRL